MKTPNGSYTIEEAAELWIGMIESADTKATPEAKAEMVAKIRKAAPDTRFHGAYGAAGAPKDARSSFIDATNAIKREMNRR